MKLGIMGAAAVGLIISASPATPKSLAHISIQVIDQIGIPAATRDDLQANAARILGEAGIAVAFIDCVIGRTMTGEDGCDHPLGPTGFVLRISQPALAMDAERLGYAIVSPEGGTYATVFFDLKRRQDRIAGLKDGTLLGHAAAHEIGHLLLGANSHSSYGIMQSFFRRSDDQRMAQGHCLYFSADQARLMRAALAARAARESYPPGK